MLDQLRGQLAVGAKEREKLLMHKSKLGVNRCIYYFARQERQHLPYDGIETLAYLSLFVHLHIQAIRHLVILQRERERETLFERQLPTR